MKDHLLWGCIADDFTGASDAASFFVKGGLKTLLFNGLPSSAPDAGCQAIVIALKTRTQETSSAVRDSLLAARWLKEQGARQLYVKYCSTFDSTPKGNIGPILDALLEEYELPCTILCPALPVNGRQVIQGKLYVNGVPLDQSPMRHHPLTPMWNSRISVLMDAQSKYPSVNVDGSQYLLPVSQTAEKIRQFATEHSHFYIIPDYEKEEDAAAIVDRFGSLPLLSGGSGLLAELASRVVSCRGMAADEEKGAGVECVEGMTGDGECVGDAGTDGHAEGLENAGIDEHAEELESAETDGYAEGLKSAGIDGYVEGLKSAGTDGQGTKILIPMPALLLAGSCSDMTRRQIAYAQNHNIASLKIIPWELLDGSLTVDDLWNFVCFHQDQEVLLYSSDSAENVKSVQKIGKKKIAQLLEQTMAQLARRAVDAGYTRIIVAGGETSGAVTRALGFDSYFIGESVAPGVPVMIPQNHPDVRLVLKSGNFGGEDFFLEALRLTE